MSFSSFDDRKRNAASETMSLRMLINLAFRCAVMCVLKKCCHLSESLSVVRVRGFTTIRGRHFSSELWEEVVSLASYRRAVAASTKEIYYVDK